MKRLNKPKVSTYLAQWELEERESNTIMHRLKEVLRTIGAATSPLRIHLDQEPQGRGSREYQLRMDYEYEYHLIDGTIGNSVLKTVTQIVNIGRIFSLGNCGVLLWDRINDITPYLHESSYDQFLNVTTEPLNEYFLKTIFMFTNRADKTGENMIKIFTKKYGENNVVYYKTPFVNKNSENYQIHGSVCFK